MVEGTEVWTEGEVLQPSGDGRGVMERWAAGPHPRKAPSAFLRLVARFTFSTEHVAATKRRGQRLWLLS